MKQPALFLLMTFCATAPALAGEQRCDGPQRRAASEFRIVGDGSEILDTKSNLVWRRCIEGQTWTGGTCQADDPRAVNPGPRMTYGAAQQFAASLSTPEKSWRLPKAAELIALREAGCYNPSFSLDLFPTSPDWSSDGFFWTSTPDGGGLATISAIGTSDAHETPAPDHVNHVRLVRANRP